MTLYKYSKSKKGHHMNILEQYHIYKICQQGKHLNDIFCDSKKPYYHASSLHNNNPI
jgi:CDGSH-type Zn-finger protein